MINVLTPITLWHWIILGVILLTIDALGAGGFLLGIAIGAFITALANLMGFSVPIQLVCFALVSVVATVVYWKKFRSFNLKQENHQQLNDRFSAQIDRTGTVVTVDGNRKGRMLIGDTLWNFQADCDVSENSTVKVISVTEGVLQVTLNQ